MTRRARREPRPKTPEEPRLVVEGDPIATAKGAVVIVQVAGFGPRVIKATYTVTGDLVRTPRLTTCIHARPLVPAPARYGGVDRAHATPEAYDQVCRLCAYEVGTITKRREQP